MKNTVRTNTCGYVSPAIMEMRLYAESAILTGSDWTDGEVNSVEWDDMFTE